MVQLLDEAIEISGTRIRFGLDGVIGLIPVVGDILPVVFGYVLLQETRQLGVSKARQARIIGNALLDTAGGLVPGAGDPWDFAFKAHKRNLKLIQDRLEAIKSWHTLPGRPAPGPFQG